MLIPIIKGMITKLFIYDDIEGISNVNMPSGKRLLIKMQKKEDIILLRRSK
jgi:hypothetical protein